MKFLQHHQVLQKLFVEHFGTEMPVTGVEIGTYCGDSACSILRALPNCNLLFTIDPWDHVDGAQFEAGEPQEYHDKNRELALSKLGSEEFKERVRILHTTSKLAYDGVFKPLGLGRFDFVWIDGDHSIESFQRDVDLYLPLVKEGGIFGGHDFGQVHPLTEEIFKRFDRYLNSGNDYTWWVYV